MNSLSIIGIVCISLFVALIIFEIVYSQSNRWWRFRAKPGDKCYFTNCYGDKTWYIILDIDKGIALIRELDDNGEVKKNDTPTRISLFVLNKY